MSEIKTLFDAASEVESVSTYIDDALDALRVVMDGMEGEGLQTESNFDELTSIHFGKRFPAFYAALRILHAELERRSKELQDIDKAIYTAARAQRGGKKAQA